ncbi:hypothetical protein NLJ89_g1668 [Agrocybe chaxingu]|uniref:DUF6534 domain-containing protein n=1 Tax=Agrocybe chaxingu TaxID=84603 RepID=A0A9W8MZM1_9AGAR|nr:hypothetical protein NLJ89_g1668 [Agrocybe chaxingu]
MNFTDIIGTTDPVVVYVLPPTRRSAQFGEFCFSDSFSRHLVRRSQKARQLISGYVNTALFGILSVQVFIFHSAFPCDALYLKFLGYGIYILETVQTALIVQQSFRVYVISFGNIEGSNVVGTSWFSVPILTSVDTCAIQLFYARRVYILSQRKPLVVVILLIWNASSALCDSVITTSIIYYLSHTRSPMRETQTLVRKVIQLSLETGFVTSAISIIALLLMVLPGNKVGPAYEGVAVILGKVYANSMLVLINRRARMTSGDREPQAFGGGTTRISFRMPDIEDGGRTKPPAGERVAMGVESLSSMENG